MGTGQLNAGGNPVMNWHPIQGGVAILPVASCYRNWDRLWPDGSFGLYADLTLPTNKAVPPCLFKSTNLFVEQFIDFMFHWIKQLHLPSREPNQQLQAVRRPCQQVKIMASWNGAFIEPLIKGLCKICSLE